MVVFTPSVSDYLTRLAFCSKTNVEVKTDTTTTTTAAAVSLKRVDLSAISRDDGAAMGFRSQFVCKTAVNDAAIVQPTPGSATMVSLMRKPAGRSSLKFRRIWSNRRFRKEKKSNDNIRLAG